MSNEGISGTRQISSPLQDVTKLHGLENAALQHAKQKKQEDSTQPAFVIEIGRPEPAAPAYVPQPVRAEAASGDPSSRGGSAPGFRALPAKMEVAENARVQMNLRVEDQITTEKLAEDGAPVEGISLKSSEHTKAVTSEILDGEIVTKASLALKQAEHRQPIEGTGETVVAGKNASAQNSVQTDQSVAGGTLVVSDGRNVKANLQIDMVAMTAPKNLASPLMIPPEQVRPDLPPTAADAIEGVETTEQDALTQPNREEAVAANQGEIRDEDNNMDARWLLLKDLTNSMKGPPGWRLAESLPEREPSPETGKEQIKRPE